MAHLTETYEWISGFQGKALNLPATAVSFIEIVEVQVRSVAQNPVHYSFISAFEQSAEKVGEENSQFHSTLPFAASECFSAPIVDVRQLVNNDGHADVKSVYELTLKIRVGVSILRAKHVFNPFFALRIQDHVLPYLPGDTFGILPENCDAVVHEITGRSADLKSKCSVPVALRLSGAAANHKKVPKVPSHLPRDTTTVFKVLKEAVDLSAIPKKGLLCAIARLNCVTDPIEKLFLEILASREGAAVYTSAVLQSQKSFLDIFRELKSMKFTLESISLLMEHLPRLMPRPYSVACSQLATRSLPQHDRTSTILRIVFSVNEPPGITTRLLEQKIFKYQVDHTLTLDLGEEAVNLYLRQSNRFRLTDEDYSRPLILIGIGTGLAPFIGFLQHRQESMKKFNRQPGFCWLIFGCRQKAKQLCANEIREFRKSGALNQLDEAFSRDSGLHEKYVQDVISCNGEAFAQRFLPPEDERATKTFICGNRKMAQDVRSAIEAVLVKRSQRTEAEANALLDDMVKNGRYIEDIWT